MLILLLLLLLVTPAAAQAQGGTGVSAKDFAIGLSGWPPESFCDGPLSAAMQQVPPKEVRQRVRRAAECGVRLVLIPPRRMITVNNRPDGPFSIDRARELMDRYAEELPSDFVEKYKGAILGFNLADDYGCKRCWGGEPITQSQIAEWAAYARTKLPDVPLGVRVVPDWVEKDPELAPLLDYAWAQYHTGKGDAKSYFDRAAKTAEKLGLRVVMGVNVHDCYGVGTDPCSPEDLIRYGRMALSHPASCAFINWKYDERAWLQADMRKVWDELADMAKKRGAQECRKPGTGAGTSGSS